MAALYGKNGPAARAILDSLDDEEPVFIIRGRDYVAAYTVGRWLERASMLGAPPAKLQSAEECRRAIIEWQKAHPPHTPD